MGARNAKGGKTHAKKNTHSSGAVSDKADGKWAVKGSLLCWDLTWLGATYGFKSACASVSHKAPGLLELRTEADPDLTFAVAKPL